MKRTLVLFLTLASLLLVLSPTEADVTVKRVDTTPYNYRACNQVNPVYIPDGYVCTKMVVNRQADGLGYHITRIHIYAQTRSGHVTPCGAAFGESPAVGTIAVAINGIQADGDWVLKWGAVLPNLADSNNCDKVWNVDIDSNTNSLDMLYHYDAKLYLAPDVEATTGFRLVPALWACNYDYDECSRSVA